jgi:hypothetical protein
VSHPVSAAPVIVSICGDAGGAAALVPVLRELECDASVRLVAYAYRDGINTLRRAGLPVTELSREDAASAAALLADARAAVVLAATSCNADNHEQAFVRAAAVRQIPSVAVLDFWSNYACRFTDGDGRLCLPDLIAVMDDRAQRELCAIGVPVERVRITGQPAFDTLLASAHDAVSASPALRARLGGADALLVTFASQPLRAMYARAHADPRFLGYDEQEVLAACIDAVTTVDLPEGMSVRLIIKCHPAENRADFEQHASPRVQIASHDIDARELAVASDLVVGMNSMFLVEACLLGCPVVSLQPGLAQRDVLPTNAWGVSEAVYSGADIGPVLGALLRDPSARDALRARTRTITMQPDAVRRVTACVHSVLADAAPAEQHEFRH